MAHGKQRDRNRTTGESGVIQAKRHTAPGKRTLTQGLVRNHAPGAPIQGKGDLHAPAAQAPADSGAQALPAEVQGNMEAAFGFDFSGVRVYQGDQAPAMGASAYTQGTDVHFAPGQYQPQSQSGQELIGHELAHVVQQSQGRVATTRQASGAAINDDPGLEAEADRMGAQAARGQPVAGLTGGLASAAGGHSVQRKANASAVVQRFAPGDDQQDAVTAALDSLLGVGNDPGGVRAIIVNKASGLAQLEAAVDTIVNQAAVPQGERVALLNQLGNDAELTAQLLVAATSASGAGTPAVRLGRVLAANPAAPRTFADLQPLLLQTQQLDDKILRGRVTGGEPPLGQKPTGEQRNLIGGHSPEIMNDDSFVIENDVHNPNDTHYISFRKLIRSDGGAAATAVRDNAAHNPVAVTTHVATAAQGAANSSTEPAPSFPADLQVKNPAGYAKAKAAHDKKVLQWQTSVNAVLAAHGLVTAAAAAAQLAAGNAAANPTSAAQVKPFVDAMTDMLTGAEALLRALQVVDPGVTAGLVAMLNAAKDAFEQNGPVLSAKKNSTTAPVGWSDDQVLRAGDETAQVAPTLIRQDATNNNPVNGSQVDTKHHKLFGNIVWVVIKEGVTLQQKGPPPTFTGGSVTSSYPTSLTAIPADKVHPDKDEDRFSTIPA